MPCSNKKITWQEDNGVWGEKIQKRGVEVWAWTVNPLKRMKRLHKRGFDGIVTDYPNLPYQLNSKLSR